MRADLNKARRDFQAARKEFNDAYARLRRFIDKQKLEQARKNLKAGAPKAS